MADEYDRTEGTVEEQVLGDYEAARALYGRLYHVAESGGNTVLHKPTLKIFTKISTVPLEPITAARIAANRLHLSVAAVFSNQHSDELLQNLDISIRSFEYNQDDNKGTLQVWASFQELANASDEQILRWSPAWLVRKERVVLVWAFDLSGLEENIEHVQSLLRDLALRATTISFATPLQTLDPQGYQAYELRNAGIDSILDDVRGSGYWERPQRYAFAVLMGCITFSVITLLVGVLAAQLTSMSVKDRRWVRLCWLIASPALGFWLLPFAEITLRYPWQLVQACLKDNSNCNTWSGSLTSHRVAMESGFNPPNITILMPVYKENLRAVMVPTVRSLIPSIHSYQLAAGKVNILVADDGLQLISEKDRRERIDFYSEMGLGWVARPRHGLNGYARRGKFKKASNLNNTCYTAVATEELLKSAATAQTAPPVRASTSAHRDQIVEDFVRALSDSRNLDWAGGDVRLGDIIFIIDSDDRFPKNFILPTAVECFLNPQLAILHFLSNTMFVGGTVEEKWCAWVKRQVDLTRRSYAISGASLAYSGGLCAVRRTAMQSISYYDEDGRPKYWSESHISEDLDYSLRTLAAGHQIRIADYRLGSMDDHFLEGVSLTIHDEIAWYEKNAVAKVEFIFNPLRIWIFRGPFTPLFRYYFLHSSLPIAQRIKDLSFMAQDFAIASSFPLVFFNYFFLGLQDSQSTWPYHLYWRVFLVSFSALAVFTIVLICLTEKIDKHRFLQPPGLMTHLVFSAYTFLVIAGISLNMTKVMLCYMLEINISWGATVKVYEITNIWWQILRVLRKYFWRYFLLFSMTGVLIGFAISASGSSIRDPFLVVPMAVSTLAHLIVPMLSVHRWE